MGLDALGQIAGGMGAKVWRGVKLRILWEEFQVCLRRFILMKGFRNPIVPAG